MESSTRIKGIEQGRAKFAFECVKKVVEDQTILKKSEYRAYVKKVPMYIKTNGLGPTLAFINSKKDIDKKKSGYAYLLIYNQISEWIKKDEKQVITLGDKEELVEKVVSISSSDYRAVTIEILALFNWMRRFVEGMIEGNSQL